MTRVDTMAESHFLIEGKSARRQFSFTCAAPSVLQTRRRRSVPTYFTYISRFSPLAIFAGNTRAPVSKTPPDTISAGEDALTRGLSPRPHSRCRTRRLRAPQSTRRPSKSRPTVDRPRIPLRATAPAFTTVSVRTMQTIWDERGSLGTVQDVARECAAAHICSGPGKRTAWQ